MSQDLDFIFENIQNEEKRQRETIELIASENFVSANILRAQGSVLTNKYAEGYPFKRYYGGCVYVDEIEKKAIEWAQQLFEAGFANVQPHSGSQANQAVFLALLKPNDRILSMDLAAGGHLSHGAKVSLSGKWFEISSYGVDPLTHRLCYESVLQKAKEFRPNLIIAGASSYPREIDFSKFRQIADEVGAYLLADIAHISGLVVSKAHMHPFPFADVITTTTHKTLRGPRGGLILTQRPDLAKKIDSAVFPGVQGGPLMHVIAAKAVCFYEALQPSFKEYILNVIQNCKILASALQEFGFSLISGGTDNHLLLVDLSKEAYSGLQAQELLENAGLTCNKNAIPNDQRAPRETSGLRLGTAAMTTKGFGKDEFRQIAYWMHLILHKNQSPESLLPQVRQLCANHAAVP